VLKRSRVILVSWKQIISALKESRTGLKLLEAFHGWYDCSERMPLTFQVTTRIVAGDRDARLEAACGGGGGGNSGAPGAVLGDSVTESRALGHSLPGRVGRLSALSFVCPSCSPAPSLWSAADLPDQLA